jgi:hypothetical protein
MLIILLPRVLSDGRRMAVNAAIGGPNTLRRRSSRKTSLIKIGAARRRRVRGYAVRAPG